MTLNYDANGQFSVIYNGVTYYYVQNAQGDVIAITNASGTRVVEYTYDAWGNILSTTGSMRLTLGSTQPFRYRGYVYDAEMGLYYLQSRYYDPALGRFICADAMLTTGQGLTSYNMFAYCLNNPISLIDDSGCKPKSPYEYDYGNGVFGYTDTGTGNANNNNDNNESNLILMGYSEHHKKGTTNKANRENHQKGLKRKTTDKHGGEKGDARRKPNPNKRRMDYTEFTYPEEFVINSLIVICGTLCVAYLITNDLTGVGVADDVAIPIVIEAIWDSAEKLVY